MLIFTDFDDVLFDTKQYKKDLKDIFLKKGVSDEIFDKYYYDPDDEGVVRTYEPREQLKRIQEEGINIEGIYEEVEEFIRGCRKYLFKDTHAFLKSFEKDRIFIVSYGNTHSQKLKIDNCEMAEYCRRIAITNGPKSQVIEKAVDENWNFEDKIFFIEDRIEQINEVKGRFPFIKTIFMRRAQGRYNDEPNSNCDFEARNLKEAEKIIKGS